MHKVSDEFVRFLTVTATLCTMMTCKIEEVSAEDEEFSELHHFKKEWNLEGWPAQAV